MVASTPIDPLVHEEVHVNVCVYVSLFLVLVLSLFLLLTHTRYVQWCNFNSHTDKSVLAVCQSVSMWSVVVALQHIHFSLSFSLFLSLSLSLSLPNSTIKDTRERVIAIPEARQMKEKSAVLMTLSSDQECVCLSHGVRL